MKVVDKNLKYCVEYDHKTRYSCKQSGCDYICRCGEIYGTRVKSVNINLVVGEIYDTYFDDSESTKRDGVINSVLYGITKEIDIYTIDRILRKFEIWRVDNWQISIKGGYYGEEIGDISIRDLISKEIEGCLDIAFSIDDLSGRIEYLLGLEYGHLLPELEGCKYELVEVLKDDISRGNTKHKKSIFDKDTSHYDDSLYSGIRGIALQDGVGLRLIDGYHRIHSTKRDSVKILRAYK